MRTAVNVFRSEVSYIYFIRIAIAPDAALFHNTPLTVIINLVLIIFRVARYLGAIYDVNNIIVIVACKDEVSPLPNF